MINLDVEVRTEGKVKHEEEYDTGSEAAYQQFKLEVQYSMEHEVEQEVEHEIEHGLYREPNWCMAVVETEQIEDTNVKIG